VAYRRATLAIDDTRRAIGAESAQASRPARGNEAATPPRLSQITVRCCSAISVRGRASRTKPTAGCVTGIAAYKVSYSVVVL
jgi:hypothetical protein